MKDRLIISLYDYTGNWAKPYIQSGYPVILWDKKIEGDILEGFTTLIMNIEQTGLHVHGLLAAVPCTDFASSGARWFSDKDKPSDDYFPFASATELSCALVLIVLHLIDILKPKWWALENPVGRIESLVPEIKLYRRLMFDPCDFGDPYTKRTVLWGNFNSNLRKTPVLPLYGSMMHKISGGPKQSEIRSATPRGFAKAFFNANQ